MTSRRKCGARDDWLSRMSGPEWGLFLGRAVADPSRSSEMRRLVLELQLLGIRFLKSRGVTETEAEDLVQDALYNLTKYLSKTKAWPVDGASIRKWFCVVCTRRHIDLVRRNRVEAKHTGRLVVTDGEPMNNLDELQRLRVAIEGLPTRDGNHVSEAMRHAKPLPEQRTSSKTRSKKKPSLRRCSKRIAAALEITIIAEHRRFDRLVGRLRSQIDDEEEPPSSSPKNAA